VRPEVVEVIPLVLGVIGPRVFCFFCTGEFKWPKRMTTKVQETLSGSQLAPWEMAVDKGKNHCPSDPNGPTGDPP